VNRIARGAGLAGAARPGPGPVPPPPYLNERRTSGQASIGRVSGARDGAKANRPEDEPVAFYPSSLREGMVCPAHDIQRDHLVLVF